MAPAFVSRSHISLISGEALSTVVSARTGTVAAAKALPAESWMSAVTWTSYRPPGRSGLGGVNRASNPLPWKTYCVVPVSAVACPDGVKVRPFRPVTPSLKSTTIGPLRGGDAMGVTSCGGVLSTCHWYCWLVDWYDWFVTDTEKVWLPWPMSLSVEPFVSQPTVMPSSRQATELAGSPAVSPSVYPNVALLLFVRPGGVCVNAMVGWPAGRHQTSHLTLELVWM